MDRALSRDHGGVGGVAGRQPRRPHAGETVTIPADRLHTHIWYSEIAHVPWLVDKSVDWLTVTATTW